MFELKRIRSAHLIGIGGINMSAVAKLLFASGIQVSGSDLVANDQTEMLAKRGATVCIGESAEHIPAMCDVVIYTSAAPPTNKERMAAAAREIPQMTNFAFLGEWFADAKTIVVSGTHGKSTTTAMLGLALEHAGLDPTVIVGSKVPGFPDGNLRLGRPGLFVVEGDEYARHFLEFQPDGVILNNLELDHTDVFPDLASMIEAFRELISRIRPHGIVVANASDPRLRDLLSRETRSLEERSIKIVWFGEGEVRPSLSLTVPGTFNRMNATGAFLMARELGVDDTCAREALLRFTGIWRRFELIGTYNDANVYSDYGHHPTAVTMTLAAAHEAFPGQRILLCFQPHHRNRTKSLFLDFVPSFDQADMLVLAEIYDVAGRDAAQDQDISSQDVMDAVIRHDADRGVVRTVEYAPNPDAAVARACSFAQRGDVVICMGAGDIDGSVRRFLHV